MTAASSQQTENLGGKRALVSGGTRGTGAAVAARLLDDLHQRAAHGGALLLSQQKQSLARRTGGDSRPIR